MENRSLTVEQWIHGYGVAFTHQQVALEEINRKASLHYQNRGATRLDEHNVRQMKAWMAPEDRHVPPVVLARASRNFVVIDGNHRVAAAAGLGRSKLDAYIVDVKPGSDIFDQMVLTANTRNGKSLSTEEMYDAAVLTMELKGVQAAAQEHLVDESTLKHYAARKKGARQYREVFRAAPPAHLAKTVLEALARADKENIEALGKDVIDKSTRDNLTAALKQIRLKPAAQQLAYAEQQSEELRRLLKPEPKSQARSSRMTVSRLAAQLNGVTNHLEKNPTWTAHASLRQAYTRLETAMGQ